MSGNVLAQGIAVVSIPIITRLFTPETYGCYAVFISVALIIGQISTFCYQTAIIMPDSENDALSLTILCFMSVTIVTAAVSLFCWNNREFLQNITGLPLESTIIGLLPLVVFLHGNQLTLSFWQLRRKRMGCLSTAKILESITDRGLALTAGFSGWTDPLGLIVAKIASGVVAISVLLRGELAGGIKSARDGLRKVDPVCALRKYRRFAVFNTPSVLLTASMLHLPAVIISYFYSAGIAGLYAIGNAVMNLPINMLGDAFARTYLQYAAENRGEIEKLKVHSKELLSSMIALLLVPFVFLGVVGKELFTIILGPDWGEAGVYIQILALFGLSTFLAKGFGGLFDVLEKQHVRLKLQLLNFIGRIGVLTVLGLNCDIIITLMCYSSVGFVLNMFAVILILSYIRISKRTTLSITIRNVAKSLPFVMFLILVKIMFSDQHVLLLTLAFFILFAWFIAVFMDNQRLRIRLKSMLSELEIGMQCYEEK
jgi:O-antigen/teichoic acid export membrane protein